MTFRTSLRPLPFRRGAGILVGLALGVAALTGCGADGTSTDCGLDACTVTFDRGVEASVNILGVEARLVAAEGDQATVEVAGQRLTLTIGEQAAEVAGLAVTLERADADEIVVRIGRN
jgi:hypothetical protein